MTSGVFGLKYEVIKCHPLHKIHQKNDWNPFFNFVHFLELEIVTFPMLIKTHAQLTLSTEPTYTTGYAKSNQLKQIDK